MLIILRLSFFQAARMDTDDEEALREKLLEKAAARNGATER